MSSLSSLKHLCGNCPYRKYMIAYYEGYYCGYGWDGYEETLYPLPSAKKIRCRFGKDWFEHNINKR